MSAIHTCVCVLLWISLATQEQTPGRTQTSLCPADPTDPSAGKHSQSFETLSFLLRTWFPPTNKITCNLKLKLARMLLAFKKGTALYWSSRHFCLAGKTSVLLTFVLKFYEVLLVKSDTPSSGKHLLKLKMWNAQKQAEVARLNPQQE